MKASPLLFFALLVPCAVFAADFDYDYLDVGHTRVVPQSGPAGSGGFVDLSYGLTGDLEFRGGYTSLSYPVGVEYKNYSAGIGGQTPITDTTDVYTDLLYINDRYSHSGTSFSDDGYRVAIGLRHRPWGWDFLEADGYLAHNYLSGYGGSGVKGPYAANVPGVSTEVGVSLLYSPIHWLAVGVGFSRDNNSNDAVNLKLRLYF